MRPEQSLYFYTTFEPRMQIWSRKIDLTLREVLLLNVLRHRFRTLPCYCSLRRFFFFLMFRLVRCLIVVFSGSFLAL